MSPAPLLALLGVILMLPGEQALVCHLGTLEEVWNASQLPVQWTPKQITCDSGQGCQDTLVLTENGPLVSLVLTKGCTEARDQEPRVTQHQTGPGISVVSYTHVCRQGDFCNDLNDTAPVWAQRPGPTPAAPGNLRCPVCLSTEGCLGNVVEESCPSGSTQCYNGVLGFRGGGISTNLRVQGCMFQSACNLLNGTREIGPMNVSESCDPKDFLNCHRGTKIQTSSDLAQKPVEWSTSGVQACGSGQVCQETLLLIDVGSRSTLVGSKGCSEAGAQDSQVTSIHSRPPGVLVASYARFCSSNLCNAASSSSVLLNSLPPPAASVPGNLQCPACVQPLGTCSQNSPMVTCPKGTTHCYDGSIDVRGGGLTTTMGVQGCVSSSSLLNHTKTIGIFSMHENNVEVPSPPDGVASAPALAWVVVLGLSLALWCGGGFCLSC
ncbi:CD177 antigen [Carlito syrichta]|uniref:CD177 antigen n=1 Tax=Carlito syrichta TaxID=1868482 RepID=A0A1U7T1I5_CARSF|nr:CD177 antigen [Carlito syrichta]